MKMTCRGQFQDPKADAVVYNTLASANKWKQVVSIVIVLFIWGNAQAVFAQGAVKYSITYVTESKTTFQTNDSLNTFTIEEQLQLMPVTTRDSIIKLVYTNNDIKTTIYHQVNTGFPEWATQPAKTIIDKTRIKVYDDHGALLINQAHSAKFKSKNNQLKSFLTTNSFDIIPDFVYLSPTMKTDFTARGFVMTNLGDGTFRFVKDSVTLFYNNSRRTNELILTAADGTTRYGIKRAYQTNVRGVIVPAFEIKTKKAENFIDHCVNEVAYTNYVYYDYTTFAGGKWEDEDAISTDDEPLALQISPNPANSTITIQIPIADNTQTLNIYDNTGKMVFQSVIDAGEFEIQCDITYLESGIYYAQLQHSEALITTSFIKN